MAKIDITKVTGTFVEEGNSLLPGHNPSKSQSPRWKSWQPQIPLSIRSPRVIWSFVTLILFLQSLVIWRLFFYQEPLPPGPPYNVAETVALVTEYYKLLQAMHYLPEGSVAYPPHVGAQAINVTIAQDLGLSPLVIETLNLLPYIQPTNSDPSSDNADSYLTNWSKWTNSDHDVFFHSGKFVDYRVDTNLYLSRDPLTKTLRNLQFDNTPLETGMKGMTAIPNTSIPLSIIRGRRYGVILLLETSTNRILFLDTQGSQNSDPFLQRWDWDKIPRKYHMPADMLFYGYEVRGANYAPNVLRELIQKTADLSGGYVPGNVRSDPTYTPELSPPQWEHWMSNLYHDNHWPERSRLSCVFPSIRREKKVGVCDKDPWEGFNGTKLEEGLKELVHKVETRYLKDWYCPVPREKDYVEKLKGMGRLSEEQVEWAESDGDRIPFNMEGWGKNLIWLNES